TYKDVLTVQPFGNSITKSNMTGANITEYLNSVAMFEVGSGAYAQFIGVSMTVDCSASTVDISDINGKGYDASATYSFTVPSYNAAGGDGYPILDPIKTGYVDAEVLYTYLKDKRTITPGEFTPTNNVVYSNSLSVNGCQL
uniref:5'-nucleotidase C-terminal domain-containing protein n=1 Tax=Psychromonas sp. Urea-02u-13 TaxID=2058326 RepID=UPI000CCAD38D